MAVIASSKVTLMLLNQVASTKKYYLLRDSLLSWPTPNPPISNVEPPTSGGIWSTIEPPYVNDSTDTLYTTEQTKYTDGSIEYSEISKSSSYEASKAAYELAKQALTREKYPQDILAKTSITAGFLSVGNDDGYCNLIYGTEFDLTLPMLLSESSIGIGTYGGNNYVSYPTVDVAAMESSFSGTTNKSLFVRGTMQNNIFKVDSNQIFTDTPFEDPSLDQPWDPITNPVGSYYLLVGTLHSPTKVVLSSEHTIYRFYDNQFKTIGQIASDALSQAESAIVSLEGINGSIGLQEGRLSLLEDPIEGLPSVKTEILSINDLLGTKSVIHRSQESPLEPIVIPGELGDQWWRYNTDGAVIGLWMHNGTTWIPTTLSDKLFGSISAGLINTGTLDAQNLIISNLLPSKITGLDDTLDEIYGGISTAQEAIDNITGVISVGNGQITITNGVFQMVLDHDSIEFKVSGTNVASIIGNKLVVKDAEIASVPTATALLGAHELSIGGAAALDGKVTVFRSR